jgi:hypothetical protein
MQTSSAAAIRPRKPQLALDAGIPRRWLSGSAAATGVANGVNLLFPWGERFFVRSVRRYLDGLDPELREQARGFFGQEGRHAGAHEQFFEVMRGQGYEIDRFLARYERIAAWIEAHAPAELSLATTAALEHFTATLADGALRDGMLEYAHPAMRELLLWHAAEEIEHKAVAFDALSRVSPGYALRMAGLFMASTTLFGFWVAATAMLWRQDGLTRREGARELARLRRRRAAAGGSNEVSVVRRVLRRGLREYVRPGFHPSDNDNAALARDYLARAGLEAPA